MPVLSGLGFRASHLDHLKRYTAIHFVPLKPHSQARLRYAYIYCEADLTRSAKLSRARRQVAMFAPYARGTSVAARVQVAMTMPVGLFWSLARSMLRGSPTCRAMRAGLRDLYKHARRGGVDLRVVAVGVGT